MNYRGTRFWHTAIYAKVHWLVMVNLEEGSHSCWPMPMCQWSCPRYFFAANVWTPSRSAWLSQSELSWYVHLIFDALRSWKHRSIPWVKFTYITNGCWRKSPVVARCRSLPLQLYSKRNWLIPDETKRVKDTRLRCSRIFANAQNYIFAVQWRWSYWTYLAMGSLKIEDWNPSSSHFQSSQPWGCGRMMSLFFIQVIDHGPNE